MKEKLRKILLVMLVFLLIFFLLGIGIYLAFLLIPQSIKVSHYTLANDFHTEIKSDQGVTTNNIRIVQLTDLHNSEFGNDNEKLIALVEKQSPDIIVMTGDMINEDDPDLSIIKNLIAHLSRIAPVYFGYGNHETGWEINYGNKLHEELTSAGATVLNDEYVDIDLKGVAVRIGGFRGFYGFTHMDGQDEEQKVLDQNFFDNFVKTDRYRILLNHIPTQWLDWHYIDSWRTGLIFSGHYHGGQIVIPYVGGLFAPYVGWFPPYTHGCYVGKISTCILSSGLGNERSWLPRINNTPEIMVVDIDK